MPRTPLPLVVFVHGTRTSSAIWASQVEHVSRLGYDTLAVDLPGHGVRRGERLSLGGAFKVINQAITARLATGSGGRSVVLVGLSLGGYIALAYAATAHARLTTQRTATQHAGTQYTSTQRADPAPDQAGLLAPAFDIVGLIAAGCCTQIKGKPVGQYGFAVRQAYHLISLRDRVTASRRWSRASITIRGALRLDPAHLDPHVASLQERLPLSVVADMLAALAGRSTVADVRQVPCPIVFINGVKDPLRLNEKRLLAAAHQGTLIVIPHAGHDVNTEQPDAFNRVLSTVLGAWVR